MKHLRYLRSKSKIIIILVFVCVFVLAAIAVLKYEIWERENNRKNKSENRTQFKTYLVVKRVTEADKKEKNVWEWRQDVYTKDIGFFCNDKLLEVIKSTYIREEIEKVSIPKKSLCRNLDKYKNKEIPILYTCDNNITFEYISYLENDGWDMVRSIELDKQIEIYMKKNIKYLRFFMFRDGTIIDELNTDTRLTDITEELTIQ